MPKIKAADAFVQLTDVLEVGKLSSTHKHIFVIGGDNTGYLCFSITHFNPGSFTVYGNRNGLKVYYDANNVLYIQSSSSHLINPIAWNMSEDPQDIITMRKIASLPSGVTECSYQE